MNTRARIGKVLRRWADRIADDNVVPIMIKAMPGTQDQIEPVRYATGGAITGPRPDDDSVPVWLSNGEASYDGGRTWTEVPPTRRPPTGGTGEAKAR